MDARVEDEVVTSKSKKIAPKKNRVQPTSTAARREDGKVKVLYSSLEEDEDGNIVLRGVIDPASLYNLLTDDYQREVLRPVSDTRKSSKIKRAVANGKPLPDVVLGMRGEHFHSREDVTFLDDPVYIIDGLQRISTVRDWNELYPDKITKTRIGAKIHFGTSKAWEKEQFEILNVDRTPMSPNVLLRGKREDNVSIATLYGLSTNDPNFALYGRVSWMQYRHKGDLVTALILARVAHTLFAGHPGTSTKHLPPLLDAVAERTKLSKFREGIKAFFDIIDQCFGIRTVVYRETSVATKGNFLIAMASVMAHHEDFWRNGSLYVDADMKRRLRTFPVGDPSIERLSGAGSAVMPELYRRIVDHLNYRKQNKLTKKAEEK